jgi:hypothetical protein
MSPPTEISTMGPKAWVSHGTSTHLALPLWASRVVNVIHQPCAERVVMAKRPLRLVIHFETVGSGEEAAWERSLRVQRYSYVFESAGETCRVEPA